MLFDGPSVFAIIVVGDHRGLDWYIPKQFRKNQRLRKAKLVVGVPADAPQQEGRTRSILEFVHQASWGLTER